ncbi:hypothetical protein RB11993 [Rhodopirellula baltica SH 1]|uniref:Uncharacterized protein n=1 Tax=Rhodopirellula baltica (strain DSM 10527 / NCIMB 13988 / SH1) TaxID=243090 RepID=Q7UJB7_RHOBA|nr:hypothetical protein RB11993 [Rhodopirellula baltica SH 1]
MGFIGRRGAEQRREVCALSLGFQSRSDAISHPPDRWKHGHHAQQSEQGAQQIDWRSSQKHHHKVDRRGAFHDRLPDQPSRLIGLAKTTQRQWHGFPFRPLGPSASGGDCSIGRFQFRRRRRSQHGRYQKRDHRIGNQGHHANQNKDRLVLFRWFVCPDHPKDHAHEHTPHRQSKRDHHSLERPTGQGRAT